MIDINKTIEEGFKLYEKLKNEGELSFCCITDKSLIILNMILQLAKQENLKVEIKVIKRD